MSSGFISETEIAEWKRVRQEEWEKVRKPGQPDQCPEEEYDNRSLFERLQEQKQKKDLEYEEAHKLKNMIKGLDDDEVEFLDFVDRTKIESERQKSKEEAKEIRDFHSAVASLQECHVKERINSEIRSRPAPPKTGGQSSQVRLLSGAVVKKRAANNTDSGHPQKKHQPFIKDDLSKTDKSISQYLPEDTKTSCTTSVSETRLENSSLEERNTGLQCIGILPGLGSYSNSSDSDESSSDTDEDDILSFKTVQNKK